MLFVCFLAGCRDARQPVHALWTVSGPTMGTVYTVKVVDIPKEVEPAELEGQIREILQQVNARMSTYKEDSELSRFNRQTGDAWFPVSQETTDVMAEALRIAELTGGAYDVTVGPLVNLWNFGPDKRARDQAPSVEAIEAVRQRIGYQNVELRKSPPALRKKIPGIFVDLSSIAKGHAVDRVAEYLERRGIEHFLVDIGGELRAKGYNGRGTPWRIAVELPVADERAVERVVSISDRSMATSGDYRNYFEQDGVRYSHILDPRSGKPVDHRLASVTVVGPSCATADALATALFVMGPDEAFRLAKEQRWAVLLLVKTDGEFTERVTPEFASLMRRHP